MHAGDDVRQLAAFAQFYTNAAVARAAARARKDQVAHPGEPGPCSRLRSTRNRESGHLSQTTRNQRGRRVVPGPETFTDSGGDGDDVLECAAEFDPGDIIIAVDTQRRVAEFLLDLF